MLTSGRYFGARMRGSLAEALNSVPEVLYYTREDADQLATSPVIVFRAQSWDYLDTLVGEALERVGKNYRAVLLLCEEEQEQVRAKRQVTPTSAPPALPGKIVSGNGCVAYATGAIVTANTKDAKPDHLTISDSGAQTCYQNISGEAHNAVATSNMTFSFKGGQSVKSLTVKMNFVLYADRSWVLDSLVFTPTGSLSGDYPVSEVNLVTLYLNSVLGFSYACSNTTNVWIVKAKDKYFSVELTNFQVDPFNEGGAFSDNVDDCVGFFTPGIWMSIFSLIILALTLIFGLVMISSLKTMDKFDDPKGKPLHINAKD